MGRGTLGTGMMAPLALANNFNGPYYAGPSGAAMGALMAAQSIGDGLRDWGASKGRQQDEARVQEERDRVRMDELNQRQAVAQAINPMQAAQSSGMGNRDMSRRMALQDASTQMGIYKLQESRDQQAQEQKTKNLSRVATFWAINGGETADPGGKQFMQKFGYSPYEYADPNVISRMQDKQSDRDLRLQMAEGQQENARLIAGMRQGGGGDNIGTWSMTPDGRARMNNKTGELVPLDDSYAKPTAPKDTIFGKEFGKKAAQDFFKLQGAAETAQQSLAGLAAAEAALDRGIYTGTGGSIAQAGRKALVGMGMGNPDDVAAGEELTKVQNEMALITRSPNSGMGLPGAVSDKDLEFLKSTQVGVDKTPAANRRFIEAARRVKQRQLDIAEMANEYVDTHGSLDQNFYSQVRKYSDSNSMFSGMDTPAASPAQRQKVGPRPGTVVDGYEYLGGDPNNSGSWRPANGK